MEKINKRYHCIFINPTSVFIAGIWKDDNAFFIEKYGVLSWNKNGFVPVGEDKLGKGIKVIAQGRLVTWQ